MDTVIGWKAACLGAGASLVNFSNNRYDLNPKIQTQRRENEGWGHDNEKADWNV